jgi:type II secretory pathway predicted ATPase ExeA
MRWFNTAGPCQSDIHYMLPPLARLPKLQRLIEQRSYFVLHAPRQVGKTTLMMALAKQLTETGQYVSAVLSVEAGDTFQDKIDAGEQAILQDWVGMIRAELPAQFAPDWQHLQPGSRISQALQTWSESCSLPLVVLIDEIDCLQDDLLITVLRQLRSGYPRRPHHFPQSLALIGMRDVRDYKVTTQDVGEASTKLNRLNTASPFNVKVESLTLRNFNREEVGQLYRQHTEDTGQVFTDNAIDLVFDLTQGQPWLVNAIAKQIVENLVEDPTITITTDHINQAKEILIRRQDTHLDSLGERLREARVKAIIEPMLAGLSLGETSNDDRQYLIDLGLLTRDPAGGLTIANPIYREVLPRVLAQGPQDSLPHISPTWLTPEGALNPIALLSAFLSFWRQHGEPLLKSAAYHEIAPHLVLMAFLHRVVNGGGTLEREYAIGRDRMDLCLRYQAVTLGIELKVWRDKSGDPKAAGLDQLDGYLARLGLETGWLFIFDRRSNALPIAERLTTQEELSPQGRRVTIVRG